MDVTLQPTLLMARRLRHGPGSSTASFGGLKPLDFDDSGMPTMNVGIKNTFIDTNEPLSSTLAPFYQDRKVYTCPGQRVGSIRIPNVDDVSSVSTQTPPTSPRFVRAPRTAPVSEEMREQSWPATPQIDEPLYVQIGNIPTSTTSTSAKTVVSLTQALMSEQAMSLASPLGGISRHALLEPANVTTDAAGYSVPPPRSPAPGSQELPSLGSSTHNQGACKPCAFFHTKGCETGAMCTFCHLCGPEERKLRKKEKALSAKLARRMRKAAAEDSVMDPCPENSLADEAS